MKKDQGHLRVQIIEQSKAEIFMTVKFEYPMLRREKMATYSARARSRTF